MEYSKLLNEKNNTVIHLIPVKVRLLVDRIQNINPRSNNINSFKIDFSITSATFKIEKNK